MKSMRHLACRWHSASPSPAPSPHTWLNFSFPVNPPLAYSMHVLDDIRHLCYDCLFSLPTCNRSVPLIYILKYLWNASFSIFATIRIIIVIKANTNSKVQLEWIQEKWKERNRNPQIYRIQHCPKWFDDETYFSQSSFWDHFIPWNTI